VAGGFVSGSRLLLSQARIRLLLAFTVKVLFRDAIQSRNRMRHGREGAYRTEGDDTGRAPATAA
jgi:hypothetical protein